jgi:nitroreductase
MDFDWVIKKRKMIREYQQTRQVPIEILNKLLKNAHSSPSAGHTQVQEYIVVIDPITKRKLCQASLGQTQVEDASALILYVQTHQGLLIDTKKEAQNFIAL